MTRKNRVPSDVENVPELVETPPRRLFVHEPGWLVALKVGSIRENCYQIAPGQDHYHRLADGEIYLARADEKLCLACAARRGLLSLEAKSLRESITSFEYSVPVESVSDFELEPRRTD